MRYRCRGQADRGNEKMPHFKVIRTLGKIEDLNDRQIEELFYGCRLISDPMLPGFQNSVQRRAAWERFKNDLLAIWFSDPCNYADRPTSWWAFDFGRWISSRKEQLTIF